MKLEPPSAETLMDQWEKDSKIDLVEAKTEIIRIPVLHSKYNRYLMLHNLAVKKCVLDYNKMKKIKWMYYNGKLDQEELDKYGWEPFRFTLKSDISVYIEADDDLNKYLRKKAYHEEAASFCTNVMKELNNRTWQIKEYLTHDRFISGQH
jgi:hypothetical protein